jgi:double-stranded uracil-DNA glycosylase
MNDHLPIAGFAPLGDDRATVLVLGSMPSVASLEAGQYYGHSRNAFWPLMAEMFGFDSELSYEQRAQAVADHGIAIWDVLQSCQRPGSLDSDIQKGSEVANPFGQFFRTHAHLRVLVFNGRKSEQLYRRLVLPQHPATSLATLCMPSTSPAMASLDFTGKLQKWRAMLDWLDPKGTP